MIGLFFAYLAAILLIPSAVMVARLGKAPQLRRLQRYLAVSLIIGVVNTVGDFMQEYRLGPLWLAHYVHNMGGGWVVISFVAWRALKVANSVTTTARTHLSWTVTKSMAFTLWSWVIATGLLTIYEVARVDHLRQVDWPDIAGYMVGLGLTVAAWLYFRHTRPSS